MAYSDWKRIIHHKSQYSILKIKYCFIQFFQYKLKPLKIFKKFNLYVKTVKDIKLKFSK
jgi:hypothetical protein